MFSFLVFTLLLASLSFALNFDYEEVQLTEEETSSYPAIRFGSSSSAPAPGNCKVIPGDDDWPSDEEWSQFNETLGGVLLKPVPLASPCYTGPLYNAARCDSLKRGWTTMSIHANDPTSIMSQWASGDSCVATSEPNSTCVQGGYPVYVVNATTVRHMQMAVNFARNNNIRLVIKNSGHDFNGKSIGGNSLSVWVHSIRGIEYHADYASPGYTGRAVAIAAGTPASDVYAIASRFNTTIINAGGSTVGLAGGFVQGGGHSSYASYYGLAADHVLRINAITADGRLVTADKETNEDLFWAFRGGGGGNYGIITSVVIRTFPQTPLSSSSISFSTLPRANQPTTGLSPATFWEGVKAYWDFCIAICDEGGLGYNFIRHQSTSNAVGLTFTTSISAPNHTTAEYRAFVRPLLERLNEIGIPVPIPAVQRVAVPPMRDDSPPSSPSLSARAIGDTVGNTLIASRLFQRYNFNTSTAIDTLHAAIRDVVEAGGYDFHGQNYSPTRAVAGRLGDPNNAVNPAFRDAIMHAQGYLPNAWWDGTATVVSREEQTAQHDRLQSYMQKWRDISPGAGSYTNEGDAQDPDWKNAFYGSNWDRLVGVKGDWDPEGVFWVVGGAASDEWEMRGPDGEVEGLVRQDGRLCKV